MLEVLVLSLGLAMDAAAIAVVRGLARHRRDAIVLPLLFGGFHAGMSALGWLLGTWGGAYFEAWDHWIAFGLLAGIGGKQLFDAYRARAHPSRPIAEVLPVGPLVAIGLALATSIDTAAAGLTLPLLAVTPWVALLSIGVTTWACALAGHALGHRLSRTLGSRLDAPLAVTGGVLLIAIGVRVLVSHL